MKKIISILIAITMIFGINITTAFAVYEGIDEVFEYTAGDGETYKEVHISHATLREDRRKRAFISGGIGAAGIFTKAFPITSAILKGLSIAIGAHGAAIDYHDRGYGIIIRSIWVDVDTGFVCIGVESQFNPYASDNEMS